MSSSDGVVCRCNATTGASERQYSLQGALYERCPVEHRRRIATDPTRHIVRPALPTASRIRSASISSALDPPCPDPPSTAKYFLQHRVHRGKSKKGRRNGALEVGSAFWGSCEALERYLEGSDRPGIAAIPVTILNLALVLTIVGIVVADVGRPVVHEAERQTGVPISVIIGNLLVRLESDEGADAGREEIPKPLVLKGITDRSLDRIRVAERLEIIRRPIVVDEKAPLAAGPSCGTLKLEIVDVVLARIGICEAADREGDVLPLGRDAGAVVDLD